MKKVVWKHLDYDGTAILLWLAYGRFLAEARSATAITGTTYPHPRLQMTSTLDNVPNGPASQNQPKPRAKPLENLTAQERAL